MKKRKLNRSATKKAAMQNYLRGRVRRESKSNKGKAKEGVPVRRGWDEPKVNKYYKPRTATYGLAQSDTSSRQSTPAADSDSRSVTPSTASAPALSSAATTPGPESSQQSDSLDQLLSSIFAMSNPSQPTQSSTATSTANPSGDVFGLGMDQSWLDDWMKTFDPTLPMELDGSSTLPFMDASAASTPPMDFDFSSFTFPDLSNPPVATTDSGQPLAMNVDNFPIDPDLLNLGQLPILEGNLSMSSTSMPSTSATPAPIDWDVSSMMDLFGSGFPAENAIPSNGLDLQNASSAPGGLNDPLWDMIKVDQVGEASVPVRNVVGGGEKEVVADAPAEVVQQMPEDCVQYPTQAPPDPREGNPPDPTLEVQHSVPGNPSALPTIAIADTPSTPPISAEDVQQQSAPPSMPAQPDLQSSLASVPFTPATASSSNVPHVSHASTSSTLPLTSHSQSPARLSTVPTNTAQQPTAAPKQKSTIASQKEDLIRRVKERKTLLELELNKVKLQLWETTIEQGALHHVLGHYQEKEKRQKEGSMPYRDKHAVLNAREAPKASAIAGLCVVVICGCSSSLHPTITLSSTSCISPLCRRNALSSSKFNSILTSQRVTPAIDVIVIEIKSPRGILIDFSCFGRYRPYSSSLLAALTMSSGAFNDGSAPGSSPAFLARAQRDLNELQAEDDPAIRASQGKRTTQ
ncbi:hypothetical protein NMY22_g4288 [Coprinellus aureogranulatus]|nr:hypothetical protein NMY22_g4288 [Coprinellus aureogranulatus]